MHVASEEHLEGKLEPKLDFVLLSGFLAFVALFTAAFFFQRYRWRRRKSKGKSNWGFYPSSSSLGNALQQLSTFAHPQVKFVLEEKFNDETDEDSAGGPDDPVAHLHRQAARVRRGNKIDRLTVRRKES